MLGRLTENGNCVVGYMIEPVAARLARIEELEDCRATVRNLHELGIAHGGLHRESFLIMESGDTAILQGFHDSFETSDQTVLAEEMDEVERVLQEEPWCGYHLCPEG